MVKQLRFKMLLLLCALVAGSASVGAQDRTTLFLETFGDNGSSNTAYASATCYSASTDMFSDNATTVAAHYTGTGKVGKNSVNASTDYTDASGKSAAWQQAAASTTTDLLKISNIKITGGTDLSLSFGAFMTNGATTTNKITVYYKIDNGTEQTATLSGMPTETGKWALVTSSISGTGTSLTIRFSHYVTGGFTFRLDDIKVTASSKPSSNATFTNKTPSINFPAAKTYSQVPTTATGYTGTITYAMTANTAGATIDESTGLVTVTKGGSVTVKATAAAVAGSFSKSEDSYTLTVNDTRTSAGLAWSAVSADVTYGTTPYEFPTLTNSHNVSVSYESSDEDVATIDNTGAITVKNVTGSTEISAVFNGNDSYLPQTVKYTLEVTKTFIVEDGVFDFTENYDYGSGQQQGSVKENKYTWKAGNVEMAVAGRNAWGASTAALDFRVYVKNTDVSAGSMTFTVPAGNVITKIVLTGGAVNPLSANTGSFSNGTWTGVAESVSLTATNTAKINTITVTYGTSYTQTVQSYGWASHVTPAPVQFAAGDAYVVTAASVDDGLTLAEVTEAPAGTPVLLKGAGTKTITVVASATAPATNKLSVCDGTEVSDPEFYYVLAKNGDGACFKKWTGAATALNGRVVLLLNSSASRSSFDLDGSAAGISLVENGRANNDGSVYNLSGQRVAQPTKGLYIVNGKKVLMK